MASSFSKTDAVTDVTEYDTYGELNSISILKEKAGNGSGLMWQHKAESDEVVKRLGTNRQTGLTSIEVVKRLHKFGPNTLTPLPMKPLWKKLIVHFTDFFSLMLQFAAILCFFAYITEPDESMHLYLGLFLYTVVFVTSLFSFIQQHKSDQTLREFRNFLPPKAVVLRDEGETYTINASELVVGDIIQLRLGDKVPADVRLLTSNRFTVDNSSLTGESEPVELTPEVSHSNPMEAPNLAFFGCLALDGSCTGVVIATGDCTVFGQIARLTARPEAEVGQTTLQKDIHHFVLNIAAFAVLVGLLFFIVGAIQRTKMIHNIVYSIGIIVSNIPEGLVATVIVSLTASARRMGRKKVLVKQLDAIESLGSTTVICTDKTGTLTQNRMAVSHVVCGGRIEEVTSSWLSPNQRQAVTGEREVGIRQCLESLIYGASLCSTAVHDNNKLILNPDAPPTERAVCGDASEAGIFRFTQAIHDIAGVRRNNPTVATIPFNSKNKYMVTVHKCPDSDHLLRVVIKGAPEKILAKCKNVLNPGGVRQLTERDSSLIERQLNYLAGRGERVLGYAELYLSPQASARVLSHKDASPDLDAIPLSDMCFVGLISMIDPPRQTVPLAVQMSKNAGIKVIMVTGDHPDTARSIAQQVGIITREIAGQNESKSKYDEAVVVTGSEIQDCDEGRWDEILSHPEIVFARTSPQQKLEIVCNLQRMGEIVTVTGDGCNDAPALKQANTGVAMGVSGSEVSREAASIVILDDNFSSIVSGIEEGRLIFDNLKKSIAYTLTSNIPQLIPFLIFITLKIPLPLTTVLILCIDLGTDIFPAIALAYEKPESDIMRRPPRDRENDRLLNRRLISYSALQLGVMQTFAGFFAYFVVMADYGLPPLTLVFLDSGLHFASERLSNQRWMFTIQEHRSGLAYEASWFARENAQFSKYFGTEHFGFLRQEEDMFSRLHTSGTLDAKGGQAQFNNMLKIVAFETKKPPCLAFTCHLDGNPELPIDNNVQCFDPSYNHGPVALIKGTYPNSRVKRGRGPTEGCFDLWTPKREGELLRRAQTAFFAAIVVTQVFTVFACKTRILSLFQQGINNSALVFALVIEVFVSLVLVNAPVFRPGLDIRPLKWTHWVLSVPFGVLILVYDECRKWCIRKHIRNSSGLIVPGNGWQDRLAHWIHDYTLW
ncbi:Sodium/potassium-transporting ATPase subunit alpha [Gracilariopsis chorda]|uniref:Sodium/potassium-transporting ATPase subunit alpha n=1 Tax=Gracilariopsis chorda TaxID=448386 RepID=A0A2V3IGU6_9FLOR|nr:Sodium/potassium-transporting ATPase subunit alpha [Gracilariopsis chorda]|eukprot:PXF41326.1 Sodium/potassium-transporting ATPase subunit alpha [Gracilariopsis chorda]